MSDEIKEVSVESYGSRIMNSIKGVAVGLVLFCASFAILWWNEGNIVEEKAALKEMQSQHIPVKAQEPDSKNNGKLIHTSAALKSTDKIGDGRYLKPGPWLKLESKVEMYQWTEEKDTKTEKKTGGSKTTETTYRYKLDWAEGRIDSSQFKKTLGHENPKLAVEASKHQVENVQFGKFDGREVLERISPSTKLKLTESQLLKPDSVKIVDSKIYIPVSPGRQSPQIGDVRISYNILNPGDYSVMATQVKSDSKSNPSFQEFSASNGKTKFLIEKGILTPKSMLKSAEDSAKTMTMILRFVGFLVMAFGIGLVLNPFATLLDVLPIFGSLGRGAIGIFSVVVAGTLSTITIIVAMIAHNPLLLAGATILIVGGIAFYIKQKSSRVHSPQPQVNKLPNSPIQPGKDVDASRKEAA